MTEIMNPETADGKPAWSKLKIGDLLSRQLTASGAIRFRNKTHSYTFARKALISGIPVNTVVRVILCKREMQD